MQQRPAIEVIELGDEGLRAVVVDHFARDPERWRQDAADADYRALGDFYPGLRAPVPRDYLADVGPLLAAVLQKAFGCSVRMSVERALYSIVSTQPGELGLAQRIPHIDSADFGHFAMVHYLSHEDWGGTAFYRHRATGLAAITPELHRAYLDRIEREFARAGAPPAGYIEGDTDQFERIGLVGHRFNRAVIYPGNVLHCSATRNDAAHPRDPLVGRLTVAAFLLAR